MKWRIYRLPGSREVWHIDSGCGTPVFNVKAYRAADSYSVDRLNAHPRAWIEVKDQELHIVNGIAYFDYPGIIETVREVLQGLS